VTTNQITLRKQETEEKLFKILKGLVDYLESTIDKYKSSLIRDIEFYKSREFESEKQKLKNELENLNRYYDELVSISHNKLDYAPQRFTTTITRDELRRMIIGRIEVFDRNTISNWINYLLANKYIEQNPTSNRTSKGKTMPNLDTNYKIKDCAFLKKYAELKAKNNDQHSHTQLQQTSLLPHCESSSPQNQEEKKDNSKTFPNNPSNSTSNE